MRLVTHIELQDFDLKRINHLAKAAGTTTEEYIRKALGLAVERSAEDEQREIQLEVIGYENWLSDRKSVV